MDIADAHKNTKLLIGGVPYNVDDYEFTKPGKGRAIYRLKLRNLLDGSTITQTLHSGDTVEEARISTSDMQYLYKEGDSYVFMDTVSFEQHSLSEAQLEKEKWFLKEGMVVTMQMMGDKPINVTLPITVGLKVVQSAASARGDTVSAQMKTAVLETGYSIDVPAFVKEGDTIKIDTRSGKYLERVDTKK